MFRINRFFFAIIQLVLLIDSTQQSYVKQAIMTAKTFGSTMKSSMTMLHRNKNTIKNIAYGAQKKYLQTKHSFASKSVKHLGVEAIKKFKHTAPQAARGGKQLFSLEGKKNIQMRSASQMNGKELGSVVKRSADYMRGKELSSLINIVSKSKFMLPFLAGGAVMGLGNEAVETDWPCTPKNNLLNNIEGEDPNSIQPNITPEDVLGKEVDYSGKSRVALEGNHSAKASYEGDLVDGVPNGIGRMTYLDRGDAYEGNFIDGKLQGDGNVRFKNGDVYVGEFQNGNIRGIGKLFYTNGNIYEGEFVCELPNGVGKVTNPRGDVFEGHFDDGIQQGMGTMTSRNGRKFKGMYVDGLQEGKGEMKMENGDEFNGSYLAGLKDGYGEFHYENGDYYAGDWKNDCFHGQGKFYDAMDNKMTEGMWTDGYFDADNQPEPEAVYDDN